MQLQTVLCYSYIYDEIFTTHFLKSDINLRSPQDQPTIFFLVHAPLQIT